MDGVYPPLFLAAVGCPDIAPPDGMWVKRQDDKTSVGCHVTREVWQLVCVDGEWLGSELTNCSKCKSSHNFLVLNIAWSVICLLDQNQIGKMHNTQGAKPHFFGKPDMACCKRLCDKNIIHGPSGVN